MPGDSLIEHLRTHALRTDGPFTLRSGAVTSWYLDARQTTLSGTGAWLVGEAVLKVVDPSALAIGGMTMGADPIAVATAMVAARNGRELSAFSIRKEAKDHGTGGRVVGPVPPGTRVAILEDTTTTGSA
ncbi:MAG: orotate phosphoribosyltransferase, partial [Actinomycetota bacterium]|nr:orotate phosphoribosyltransferase [Actinomycetota bacterium]